MVEAARVVEEAPPPPTDTGRESRMADQAEIGRVLRHIDFVMAHWPDLEAARLPGTRRRWAQTSARVESRRRATEAGAIIGLAKAQAPVDLDVLDVMEDVRKVAHELAKATATLIRYPMELNRPTRDPRPALAFVAEHFHAAAEADGGWLVEAALDMDDDLSIVRARNRTATALRLILAGQVLDADCPWCGARPLRVEVHADEPLIVCRSRRVCEPPPDDVGTWVRDRPAWIEAEWAWLAKRIDQSRDMRATSLVTLA